MGGEGDAARLEGRLSLGKGEGRVRVSFNAPFDVPTTHLHPLPSQGERRKKERALEQRRGFLRFYRFHGLTIQRFFKNPHPVFPQNFFNLLVAKSALDQPSGEIARMRMIS
jgi:hypothetical protein